MSKILSTKVYNLATLYLVFICRLYLEKNNLRSKVGLTDEFQDTVVRYVQHIRFIKNNTGSTFNDGV